MATHERKTTTFDATDKIVGRLASQIARSLMGKTSTAYQPNVDAGDVVVVSNASKMKVTGKKMAQKVYHRHTGYPGGIRTKSLQEMWNENPSDVLRAAVSRMLPKNKHRNARLLRLTISS